MPLKAVLFDLDGTLIDSIRLFRDAMKAVFATYKVELNEAYFWHWHAHRVAWPELLDRHGLSQIIEEPFKAAVLGDLASRVRSSVSWNDGALEALQAFKKNGISIGVVTNAPLPHVNIVESRLALKQHFDVLICGEDIGKRRKPEPYGLLLAAERLSLAAGSCAYVGDQLFDMQAAARAGMKGILYKTADAVDASGAAKVVIHSLRELVGAMQS